MIGKIIIIDSAQMSMESSDNESDNSLSTSDSKRHARLCRLRKANNRKKVNIKKKKPKLTETDDNSYVEKDSVFSGEEDEKLQLIYRNNEKEDTNDNTQNIVRRELKNRVWPHVKFVDNNALKMQDLFEQGNILNELLIGMNKTSYSKCERAKFWNTYRQVVVENMSTLKSTAANCMRMTVLKGMNKFITKFTHF
jgi:hypothetical protein